jgi:hypothetical protein
VARYPPNKFYPLQLWLTTIGIAPTIMAIIAFGEGEFAFLFLFMLFALVYLIPVFLICLVTFKLLIQKGLSAILIKVLLNLIALAGVFITFQLIAGSMISLLTLTYSVAIVVSSLFYKIYRKEEINADLVTS